MVREHLLKLASDLPYLANAKAKPIGAVLAEVRAKLRQIEDAAGTVEQAFTRITSEELDNGNFDLTYLIDGVLVKDQPAGLVAPKKSLKSNISIDLAISLATGGTFLGYFRVNEPQRMALFSGESGMATIQETARRISKAAGVSLSSNGVIFSDSVPNFGDTLNMQSFRGFSKPTASRWRLSIRSTSASPTILIPPTCSTSAACCATLVTSAAMRGPRRSWSTI
ncbi:AAA family ATPase [Symmachiella macrocystis]|uniref:AAA family ATPase n=1 Tax=Symmachiella macrocystis TaxID=2527985 RepID=UPI0018D2A410|nr:AAA family ATPase [Symmachiella macrocystis]